MKEKVPHNLFLSLQQEGVSGGDKVPYKNLIIIQWLQLILNVIGRRRPIELQIAPVNSTGPNGTIPFTLQFLPGKGFNLVRWLLLKREVTKAIDKR
jgi:hypothetical protein